MTAEFSEIVDGILQAVPCSIEMPAGAGKTQLLAGLAAKVATRGGRSLVLTHTNAGVTAIRSRVRKFGVDSKFTRIDTISSWAFSLVRAYSTIAGISVPPEPDWTQSSAYILGATRVAQSSVGKSLLAASFDYLVVDEYQDCSTVQHELVQALSASVGKVVVFGDRLQAIFGFADPLADWDLDVVKAFPAHAVTPTPHRWADHNPELGQWLLDIRPLLRSGNTIDFADYQIPGLAWIRDTSPASIAGTAHSCRDFDESVVLLDKWAPDVASHASRLGGSYSVMEDIQGRFMRDQLAGLPAGDDPAIAFWLANFAKACAIGLADLDAPILAKLGRNQAISHYTRKAIQGIVYELEDLRRDPSLERLDSAADAIRRHTSVKIYRWEAWHDTLEAIRLTNENGESVFQNFAAVRARLRSTGRRRHTRIASRTLLVKGLEYDHVIVADLAKMRDPRNLYVALSRAKRSITVIGRSSRIVLQDE